MSFISTYLSDNVITNCDFFYMSTQENTEEEVQAWLDQVHYGSCCSDEPEDCQEVSEEESPEEDSKDPS